MLSLFHKHMKDLDVRTCTAQAHPEGTEKISLYSLIVIAFQKENKNDDYFP